MSFRYLVTASYIAGTLGYYLSFGIAGTEKYKRDVQHIYEGKCRAGSNDIYIFPIAESLLHPVAISFLFFSNHKWRITDWL